MKRPVDRRRFLQGTAVVAAGFWVIGKDTPALSKSPNEKLNIGIIGVGRPRRRPTLSGVSEREHRRPVRRRRELPRRGRQAVPQGQDLRRLAQAARPEGPRRRGRQHDRPHPRPGQRLAP